MTQQCTPLDHAPFNPFRARTTHLCEGSCCHLDTPLIRSVHLEVMPVRAVKSEEPRAREGGIFPLTPWVDDTEGPAELLSLKLARLGVLATPFQDEQKLRFTTGSLLAQKLELNLAVDA